jgi:putative sigma-54 modulation protein
MQIIFSGKHMEVTPALKEYALTKLQKLSRFFDQMLEVHVVESVLRNQHIVEVTMTANGRVIRAEERSPDMYTSIDLVVDKLERQLKRYKGRFISRSHQSLQGHKPTEVLTTALEEVPATLQEEEEEPTIVRTKRFAVKPMTPEEAQMEMDLIGHDFYVFRNSQSDQINVIYKRRDGHYGLIEPTVD